WWPTRRGPPHGRRIWRLSCWHWFPRKLMAFIMPRTRGIAPGTSSRERFSRKKGCGSKSSPARPKSSRDPQDARRIPCWTAPPSGTTVCRRCATGGRRCGNFCGSGGNDVQAGHAERDGQTDAGGVKDGWGRSGKPERTDRSRVIRRQEREKRKRKTAIPSPEAKLRKRRREAGRREPDPTIRPTGRPKTSLPSPCAS